MTTLTTPTYWPTRDLPVNGHQSVKLVHPINRAQWVEPKTETVKTEAAEAKKAELDADLARTVRRTSYMRQLFYFVVLLVALAGQVSGAVEALGIPLIWAIPAVGALELGGIVVLANADVRRRLGERATASRVLSAAIAGFAVAFNWLAHENKLLAGFFAGMSLLGYLVWLMHTENQRRDRLRATGDLPPTTPAYEVVGHWIRHPWMTLRAKNLAKADVRLGLYSSLTAAADAVAGERRRAAIARVVREEIRKGGDKKVAEIAVATYDFDAIAEMVAERADYNGLAQIIAARLDPRRLVGEGAHAQSPTAQPVESPTAPAQIEAFLSAQSPALALGGSADVEAPTPIPGSPSQPTPNMGGAEVAQADTPTLAEPPTPTAQDAQPTPTSTPTEVPAQVGDAQPTPTAEPAQPKAPTKPRPVPPKPHAQGAQPTVPPTLHAGRPDVNAQVAVLPELQVRRLIDLDKEFPQGTPAPGRDKAMKHMQARGYEGWASKEPAGKLVRLLGEIRAAQGAQPTAQPTPTEEAS